MYTGYDSKWKFILTNFDTHHEVFDDEPLSERLKPITSEEITLVRGNPVDYAINPELRGYVEAKWQKLLDAKKVAGAPVPTNGKLVRVSGFPRRIEGATRELVELTLGETCYKEHIATNFPDDDFSRALTYAQNANVLNSLAAVVTADDHLFYSQRGKTATFDGKISGFGIALNDHEAILREGSQSLYNQVKSAVAKEIGEEPTVELGGFAYIWDGFHCPIWIARTNLESDKLKEVVEGKIPGSQERKYLNVGFQPMTKAGWREFFARENLMPLMRPLWAYLVIKKFGPGFAKELKI